MLTGNEEVAISKASPYDVKDAPIDKPGHPLLGSSAWHGVNPHVARGARRLAELNHLIIFYEQVRALGSINHVLQFVDVKLEGQDRLADPLPVGYPGHLLSLKHCQCLTR